MAVNAKELLEQLRREQEPQNARDLLNQLRSEQQQLNTTPFPVRQPHPRIGKFGAPLTSLPAVDPVGQQARQLASQGVDVTTGAPVGRVQSGFAQNEALRVQDLQRRLSEHFGTEVAVQPGPMGLEFINPETNRRTLVDEATGTLRDIADIAGPALPAAGAAVGTLAGFLGGAPTVGGAVGGGLGEGARRFIGGQMGVREETPGQMLQGAATVGAIEGAAGKAGDVGMAAAQRARRFIRPPAMGAEEAGQALSALQADQAIAEEISERTGQRFQPFTGQMSGNQTLLGSQERALTSLESGPRLRTQQAQNETTLESFFDDLNPPQAAPNTATGRAIQNEARGQVQPRVEAAREGVEANIRRLEELTDELPKAQNSAIVADLSREAAASRKILKDAEDAAWIQARETMGVDPETALSQVRVPVDGELSTTLNRLRAEAGAAIDPATAAGKITLAPEALDGEVDLNQLQVYLSSLRRRLRLKKHGEVATDPEGRDIARLEASLKAQRNAYLRETNPELLAQIEEAEALTHTRATLFDEGLVGQLVRKREGEWQLTDSELIGRTIGSGDREAVEHLAAALSKHPAGLPTLKRAFLQFYRNEVVENGIPNGKLHRRFIERHGETIDVLFPENARIRQLGEFEQVVTRQIERFKKFEEAVNKSFRGRIKNIAPERIAESVLTSKFSVKELSRLMSLAEAAGVKSQYQAAITAQIRRRFMSPTSGLNINTLTKFVDQNAERLAVALGPQYLRDMRLLLKGLTSIRRDATGFAVTRKGTLAGVIAEAGARVTFARPLSAAGVALTRILNYRKNAAQRLLARAIEDPKALHAIVVQRDKQIRNRAVVRLLATLGGSYLAVSQFGGSEEEQ